MQTKLKLFLNKHSDQGLCFYVTFNNLSVISLWCLDVAGSSMLTFRMLRHWNSIHDIPSCHIMLPFGWPVLIPSPTFSMLSNKAASTIFGSLWYDLAGDQTHGTRPQSGHSAHLPLFLHCSSASTFRTHHQSSVVQIIICVTSLLMTNSLTA